MSLVLLLLIAFFVASIVAQKISGKIFCAICVSVSLTWLILLVMYFNSYRIDPLILGILMGGSAVGLMYYLFRENNPFQIFKFPFLVFSFWLIYLLVGDLRGGLSRDLLIVGALWLVFIIVYFFNENGYWKEWSRRIIECCKNW